MDSWLLQLLLLLPRLAGLLARSLAPLIQRTRKIKKVFLKSSVLVDYFAEIIHNWKIIKDDFVGDRGDFWGITG